MSESALPKLKWYQGLTKYHWWVLLVAVLSWTFDCMDQRIFVLSRVPAVRELIRWEERRGPLAAELLPAIRAEVAKEAAAGANAPEEAAAETDRRLEARLEALRAEKCDKFGDVFTALMILGWAVGGAFFGIYGDKWGRVRTLSVAISVYSVFTGLSGLAAGLADFCLYRFLMGCGIGGAFATAASLIAETMPEHSRAFALGLFQALSAVAGIGFALLTLRLQAQRRRARSDVTYRYWQLGLASAILALAMVLTATAWPPLADLAGWSIFSGILLLVGGFMSFIIGMLYKIVPFLAWMHLRNRGSARSPVPNMNKLLPEVDAQRQMQAHVVALALLLAAVIVPDWLARPAGIALAVASGLLMVNLLGAARRYRQHLEKIDREAVAA